MDKGILRFMAEAYLLLHAEPTFEGGSVGNMAEPKGGRREERKIAESGQPRKRSREEHKGRDRKKKAVDDEVS